VLKHIDDIRKSARERAQRRWKNYQVERNFKAAQKEATGAQQQVKPVEPSDIIEGQQDRRGIVTRAQTKFAKDIRLMMEGHARRTLSLYLISLEAKRRRLLTEKLRRLKLAQLEGEQQ
jgi:hypothetical protein